MHYRTTEKPYNTVNNYFRHRFGKKVFKVSLNAGFTCPNKDGTKGTGGCIFCSPSGSGDFAGSVEASLKQQFSSIKAMLHNKWKDAYYIPYFQANTNTYGPVSLLKKLYNTALSLDDDIVGLSIATRCDALNDDILDLLEEINQKTYLQLEIGLQTIQENTAKWMNRGHDLKCVTTAVEALRNRNIEVILHIINGFPQETKNDMLQTIHYINTLDIQGVKIHLLHIMKHTRLGTMYQNNPFQLLSRDEYVDIVTEQIKLLREDIIIHRLTGDAPKETLLAPLWSTKKFVIMNEIDKHLRHTNTHQGINYQKNDNFL